MPAKSRRSRSTIRKRSTTAGEIIDNSSPVDSESVSPIVKKTSTVESNSKSPNNQPLDLSYITNDIKWVGVVTGIVIIFLLIAYFLFR